MMEIPIPSVVGNESLVIACQTIQNPVERSHVWVVIRPIHRLGRLLRPARPRLPIIIVAIEVDRHLIRLVIEKALSHTELTRGFLELQATDDNAIDKLV